MKSSTGKQTILVGENEFEVRSYFEMVLKHLGYSVELAQDGDEVLSCLQTSENAISAILLDTAMLNRDAFETLRRIRQIEPTLPIIVVSDASSVSNIITAMKNGANDFLSKPVFYEALQRAIAKAVESRVIEYTRPPREITDRSRVFIGPSPKMKELYSFMAQVGMSEAPVLIQGETGSGKEVLARELCAQSPRAKKPFLKLNCAALPSELVESELFGYERGAFTGAFQRKTGMFELADGGTILLDEIGDMDVRLQAKLLQVLQDQEFHRIGGKEIVKVDVRVMSATHRCLRSAIEERSFREDLYYRLSVVNMYIPPLRERTEDILPMAEFLLKKHAMPEMPLPPLTAELRKAMLSYSWPGNIRELENFVRRLLIFQKPDALAKQLCQPMVAESGASTKTPSLPVLNPPVPPKSGVIPLKQATKADRKNEADTILEALTSTHWNRKQAAVMLDVDYKALLYKIKKLRLDGVRNPLRAEGAAGRQPELSFSEHQA